MQGYTLHHRLHLQVGRALDWEHKIPLRSLACKSKIYSIFHLYSIGFVKIKQCSATYWVCGYTMIFKILCTCTNPFKNPTPKHSILLRAQAPNQSQILLSWRCSIAAESIFFSDQAWFEGLQLPISNWLLKTPLHGLSSCLTFLNYAAGNHSAHWVANLPWTSLSESVRGNKCETAIGMRIQL